MKLNALLLAASLGLAATPGAWAYPNPALYDNLGNTTLTEAMYETDTWGASQFTTDGNSYILKTVDLLLYRTGDTTAQLESTPITGMYREQHSEPWPHRYLFR